MNSFRRLMITQIMLLTFISSSVFPTSAQAQQPLTKMTNAEVRDQILKLSETEKIQLVNRVNDRVDFLEAELNLLDYKVKTQRVTQGDADRKARQILALMGAQSEGALINENFGTLGVKDMQMQISEAKLKTSSCHNEWGCGIDYIILMYFLLPVLAFLYLITYPFFWLYCTLIGQEIDFMSCYSK